MYQNEIEIIKSRIENKHQGDEKQLEIIFSPNKRLLVEAPAGYGKTHTMVSRIAYLISIGKLPVPKKLLALTFSVNAAYKIKKDVSKNIPELLQDLGKQINIKEKLQPSKCNITYDEALIRRNINNILKFDNPTFNRSLLLKLIDKIIIDDKEIHIKYKFAFPKKSGMLKKDI